MQELEKILEEIEEIGNIQFQSYTKPLIAVEDVIKIIHKHMNDVWIPVEERLPEDDVNVLITYADIDDDQYVGIDITNYGYAYLGGNKLDFKEWRSPFEYFGSNYKVIAWRPLPEPYRPERSEEVD